MVDDLKTPTPQWHPLAGPDLELRTSEYARLREHCPVPWHHDASSGRAFWSILGYQDITRVVRDPATFSNGGLRRLGARRPPLETDPPEHGVIRRLLQPFVLAKALQTTEESTRAIAVDLIEPAVARGSADLARDLARPLPSQVLLRWLDQPVEDWRSIAGWSDDVLPRTLIDSEDEQRYRSGDEQLWAYSRQAVAERLKDPRDPQRDPVSALLTGGVSVEDTEGVVRLLVSAGHDSTSFAVGICIHYLASNPLAQRELRQKPELIRTAVEEILRMQTPVTAMPRRVTNDVMLGETQLKAGDQVLLNWASANRDGRIIERAEVCDLNRKPNPHLVFGSGLHACLGASLARQELRICLEELLGRSRRLELAGTPLMARTYHYGFDTLPIAISPR